MKLRKQLKKSKTSKLNVIFDKVAPQKSECNERQPTSLT